MKDKSQESIKAQLHRLVRTKVRHHTAVSPTAFSSVSPETLSPPPACQSQLSPMFKTVAVVWNKVAIWGQRREKHLLKKKKGLKSDGGTQEVNITKRKCPFQRRDTAAVSSWSGCRVNEWKCVHVFCRRKLPVKGNWNCVLVPRASGELKAAWFNNWVSISNWLHFSCNWWFYRRWIIFGLPGFKINPVAAWNFQNKLPTFTTPEFITWQNWWWWWWTLNRWIPGRI